RWIPLESNPLVAYQWAKKAVLVSFQDQFQDVYGLDEEVRECCKLVPVKAVVLLYPDCEGLEGENEEEDTRIANDGQPHLLDQADGTIDNACGTMGLIHALENSEVTYTPTSALSKFIAHSTSDKTPEERPHLLETTPLFTSIHAESAESGQNPPDPDASFHFTCFVAAPEVEFREIASSEKPVPNAEDLAKSTGTGMRLVELNGMRVGPVDHGECTDLLVLVRTGYLARNESVYFSLTALAPPSSDLRSDTKVAIVPTICEFGLH
ncbi:hypothetical protein K443DRAFT_113026, partial [Laccaria amethystina LaAM-08-1]